MTIKDRRTRPSPTMRKWLFWLAGSHAAIVIRRGDRGVSSHFSTYRPPLGYVPVPAPRFDHKTLRALRDRGWIAPTARTDERCVGRSLNAVGKPVIHYESSVYLTITDKGRKALEQS